MDIVKVAKELISRDDIDVVIGYEKGRAPFQNVPFFARTQEDCEKLVLNPFSVHNLSTYIRSFKDKKVALFAKPCDIKSIIGLLQEHQINREKVHIVGINCRGVVDAKKLITSLKDKEVTDWSVTEDKIIIEGPEGKEEFPVKDFLMEKCHSCDERKPALCDQVIGEEVKETIGKDEIERIKELEKLTPEERQKYWNSEFSRCIRCYACVKTCPLCYCDRCFVESSKPQWVDKSNSLKSNKAFHIIRAFHLAGRCIGCGECDRACPMNIPLSELNRKMKKSVQEHFDYTAGKDPEVIPPLSTFEKEDKEQFIH